MRKINNIVGENLKKIREKNGFTQEKLAKAIGLNRSTYSNYESGIRDIPYDVVERISNLLGFEAYLLYEDTPQFENEMLTTSFRVDMLEDKDLLEIERFRDIVKSYLKIGRIVNDYAVE